MTKQVRGRVIEDYKKVDQLDEQAIAKILAN